MFFGIKFKVAVSKDEYTQYERRTNCPSLELGKAQDGRRGKAHYIGIDYHARNANMSRGSRFARNR